MSDEPPDFTIVSQVHINQWFPALQRAIPGWEVTVHDGVTGVIVPVFVDDDHYSVAAVMQAVEAKLAPIREVHAIGR